MAVGAWYGRAFALAGAVSALVPALYMWGFTVDDALISLRYAHHLAIGAGYRFNPHGASTDGVTPLPWAPLLALLAGSDDLVLGLERAKAFGVIAWTLAAGVLGHALVPRTSRDRRATLSAAAALGILALAFPVGAWAASGMETALATALATLAAVAFARPRTAAVLGGLVASLRPELVVWALVVAGGGAVASLPPSMSLGTRARRVALVTTLAATPFALCSGVRWIAFGRVGPLALLAKPSDLSHGAVYAAAAFVVVLMPILTLAPRALLGATASSKTLALAMLAHVMVVVAVGGDWMPFARLMVPIVPSLALVAADVGRSAHPLATAGRTLVAAALGVLLLRTAAPAGRSVHVDRKELITKARPLFAGARVVAALDVGWVGASTEADIMDLAGVTDGSIAVLRGGHTSKAVDVSMLLDRGVDTVVIYGKPRMVEQRLLRSSLFDERFTRSATITFGGDKQYEIYRRAPEPGSR